MTETALNLPLIADAARRAYWAEKDRQQGSVEPLPMGSLNTLDERSRSYWIRVAQTAVEAEDAESAPRAAHQASEAWCYRDHEDRLGWTKICAGYRDAWVAFARAARDAAHGTTS